jgi:hypothetical protein
MNRTAASARAAIPWVSDELIDFGDVQVELCLPPELYDRDTTDGRFILGKNRAMVEEELTILGDRRVERMVDVGVYKGGSVVLFHKLFSARKLVAVELNTAPLPALDAYAARHAPEIVIARGVNQADLASLDRICAAEFGGEPLDLVTDDASHHYDESRASFRALFPRLRPGGLYIVEDWSWAHWRGEYWQEQRGGAYFSDKAPLTNLLIELMLVCATSPEVVARINISPAIFYIERGAAALAPGFELADHYLARGEGAPRFAGASKRTSYASPTYTLRGR